MVTRVDHELSDSEILRRDRRKGSYHLVASRNKLPAYREDEDDDYLFQYLTSNKPEWTKTSEEQKLVRRAKEQLLREIAGSGGDTTTPTFGDALEHLIELYDSSHFDARTKPSRSKSKVNDQSANLEGMWITLSKPKFGDCLGVNQDGDFMYTLGRMSFDMFRPTQLVCSIQGTFNPVHVLSSRDREKIKRVPSSLKQELKQDGKTAVLRSYDIVTAFTIEPHKPECDPTSPNNDVNAPIEGLMTTYGYVIPNPDNPARLSIWFTGGTIEVRDDVDGWVKVFDEATLPKRKFREKTRVLGAKVIMGAQMGHMEDDGRMSYHLNRPIGGHGVAYLDLVYLDETLRIAKSSDGVVYVFARIPSFPDE